MADSSQPQLPPWVLDSQQRRVPFEADRITQDLFAASEYLGAGDSFLARELTESVLHFLAQDLEAITTTQHIREVVAKVVRELGQPALSQAFLDRKKLPADPVSSSPDQLEDYLREARRSFSRQRVFSRDLWSAQEDRWITLLDAELPEDLLGRLLNAPGNETPWFKNLAAARLAPGGFGALDVSDNLQPSLLEELAGLAEGSSRRWILNLNAAEPRYQEPSPLFGTAALPKGACWDPGPWQEALSSVPDLPVWVDWHLGEKDLEEDRRPFLVKLARAWLREPRWRIVFDRPRRPTSWGEGLDRQHPAVLGSVAVHLPRLLEVPGTPGNLDQYLPRLASLARMAVSAGVQKKNFLRLHRPQINQGFLLERARFLVLPIGLEAVIRGLVGEGFAQGTTGQEAGLAILRTFAGFLETASRQSNLNTVLESPYWPGPVTHGSWTSRPHLEGLTPGIPGLEPREQLRLAGLLHEITRSGTACLLLQGQPLPSPDTAASWLHLAWKNTALVRLRLHRPHLVPQAELSL